MWEHDGHYSVWLRTADDGVVNNGRYEGRTLLFHPTEASVMESRLREVDCPENCTIDVVFVSRSDDESYAQLQWLLDTRDVGQIVGIETVEEGARPRDEAFNPERVDYGGPLPGLLSLGGEITAKVLPAGPEGASMGLYLRFIDVTMLLPAHPDAKEDANERVDLVVSVLSEHVPTASDPEVWLGPAEHAPDDALVVPVGDGDVVRSDGSEISLPGGRYRNKHGVYLVCADTACRADLEATVQGPLFVRGELPAGTEGWFLVDTRSERSYIARDRLDLTGATGVEIEATGHGAEAVGIRLPPLLLGGVQVHGLRVHAVEPIRIAGQRVAGVLGRDVLESFVMKLDDDGVHLSVALDTPRRARLAEARRTEQGTFVPMDWSPAGPLVMAELDGVRHSLIVATALEHSIVSDAPASATRGESMELETPWLDGPHAQPTWMRLSGPLHAREAAMQVGGVELGSRRVWVPEQPITTDVIGMDFLRSFTSAELDFRERELRLVE